MAQRRLIIRILDTEWNDIIFRVEEQSHREDKFTEDVGRGLNLFTHELDGYGECTIGSYQFPKTLDRENFFFRLRVRGYDTRMDYKELRVRHDLFYNVICPTVLAYNQKYSRNTLTRDDVIWDSAD